MKQVVVVVLIILLIILVAFFFFFHEEETNKSLDEPTMHNSEFSIASSAFKHEELIPSKYTCDGEDVSPPLAVSEVPESVKSLVLIMDDPDAPGGTWDHWVVFNIPPTAFNLAEGEETRGVGGNNSWGRVGYGGPCPPDGEHRYFFKLYGLDTTLDIPEGSTKKEVEAAMEGHVVLKSEFIGRYDRK